MSKISKKSLDNFACYVALLVAAAILIITRVLPNFGVTIGGNIIGILDKIFDICVLFGVGFGAFHFSSKTKLLRLLFWIALIVYVASTFLGLF